LAFARIRIFSFVAVLLSAHGDAGILVEQVNRVAESILTPCNTFDI
jgi:hypothetical protein